MACGTGKTLIGRWHAQAIDAQHTLVLVPSLALVAQTLREWRSCTGNVATGWSFRALVVCSDPTTTAGAAERELEDDGIEPTTSTWDQVSARVTTDPAVVARFLNETPRNSVTPTVVFSTYHSSPVVAQAQARSEVTFDLAICDEAHRLAGAASKAFTTILNAQAIVARKRLFMTATPKILAVAGAGDISMDNPEIFGPVAHTVSFSEAIQAGLLTDYRVLVATEATNDPTYAPAAALIRAIDDYGVRRVLSFHGRVAKAAAFTDGVNELDTTPAGTVVRARHVSGKLRAVHRANHLHWLGDAAPDEARVISNARCLSEGVDVPAVDGILFADTRSSIIEIIQAIGRVLRPAPGKTVGTIVLPVAVPEDCDEDTMLSLSAFAQVWAVLRGLRAHDQRIAAALDSVTRDVADDMAHDSHHKGGYRIPGVEFVFPDHLTPPDLHLRIVAEAGSIWQRNLALATTWARAHNGKLLPRAVLVPYGDVVISLGEWAEQQRILHRRGLLDTERARQLEQVPGWVWDKNEARWWATHKILQTYVDEHGTVADHPAGESRFKGMYDAEQPRRHLGIWMAAQRQAYRLGVLPPPKADALQQLPGWVWNAGLPAVDVDMIEALRVFVEFEKHADVADDHLEDGLRLGAWCWAVRRRRWTDHLAPALYDEIMAATPSKFRSDQRFNWHKNETLWRIAYFALRQYTDREGTATPSGKHHEQLPDTDVGLAQWCALQRLRKRRSELPAREVELLEALPGWRWEIDLQRVEASPPIDLPSGKHGTAMAYQRHGCRCIECLEWRRASDRDRLAKRRAHFDDPVDAAPVRQHLLTIEAKIVAQHSGDSNRNGRPLVATASGVSLGVIRKIMRGVDPGPTFELIDDLKARGFGSHWIARELGYESGGIQITRDQQLAARIADAIVRLHADVGDLVMPPTSATQRRPSLAQLREQAA